MKLKSLVLTLFLVGCAVAPQPITSPAATTSPTLAATITATLANLSDSQGRFEWNFLVLGSDYREGDPLRQNEHTDAFILVNIQERQDAYRVTLMPIARELWFGSQGILYSIYQKEGFEGVAQTVEREFGLPLQAIIYADMDNFSRFIDSIGGVKMAVPFAVDDNCGGKPYRFAEGQREVFTGHDLLCLARMRAGYTDGYFSRQIVHTEILKAMWAKLLIQVGTDPVGLVDAVVAHPFVTVWPQVEWLDLGKLAIRASLHDVDYRTVSFSREYTISGQEYGPMIDGTQGYFYVRYPNVDLQEWVRNAINQDGHAP